MLTQINGVVLLIGAVIVQAQLWWLAECSLTAGRRKSVLPWFVAYLAVRIGSRVTDILFHAVVPSLSMIFALWTWGLLLVLMWKLQQAVYDMSQRAKGVMHERDVRTITGILERYSAKYPDRPRRQEDSAHAVGSQ